MYSTHEVVYRCNARWLRLTYCEAFVAVGVFLSFPLWNIAPEQKYSQLSCNQAQHYRI